MAEIKYRVCDACGVSDQNTDLAHNIIQTTHAYPKTRQLWMCRVCRGEVEGALYEALGAKLAELGAPRLRVSNE